MYACMYVCMYVCMYMYIYNVQRRGKRRRSAVQESLHLLHLLLLHNRYTVRETDRGGRREGGGKVWKSKDHRAYACSHIHVYTCIHVHTHIYIHVCIRIGYTSDTYIGYTCSMSYIGYTCSMSFSLTQRESLRKEARFPPLFPLFSQCFLSQRGRKKKIGSHFVKKNCKKKITRRESLLAEAQVRTAQRQT